MNQYIEAITNTEQLVQLALYAASSVEDEQSEVLKTADAVIVGYIVSNFAEKNIDFTEEMVQDEYRKMLTDYTLSSLVSDGLIDVSMGDDGEFYFSLSEDGESAIDYQDE